MSEMIKEWQNSEKVKRHDLFSSLLAANDEDMDIINLTESELIGVCFSFFSRWLKLGDLINFKGNIYIFLIAGHEVSKLTEHLKSTLTGYDIRPQRTLFASPLLY